MQGLYRSEMKSLFVERHIAGGKEEKESENNNDQAGKAPFFYWKGSAPVRDLLFGE
jgi:hypothetical protein